MIITLLPWGQSNNEYSNTVIIAMEKSVNNAAITMDGTNTN